MLGTACSKITTGESFELQCTTDTKWSWIVFKISAPKTVDERGKETTVSVCLHDVYLNYGKICSEEETATLELQWGSATTPVESFFTLSVMKKAVLFNPDYVAKEGDTSTAERASWLCYP